MLRKHLRAGQSLTEGTGAGAGDAPFCQHPPSSQPQAAAQHRFRSSRASICSRWGRRRGARGRRHAGWHAVHAHLLAHRLCILTHLPIVFDERQLRAQDLVIPFRALFDLDIGYEPSPICARAHVCVCVCACVYSRMTTFPSLSTCHLLPRTCAQHTASQGACSIPSENSRPTSATCCRRAEGKECAGVVSGVVGNRCRVSAVWAMGTAGTWWQGVEHLFKQALENKRWAKIHLARA